MPKKSRNYEVKINLPSYTTNVTMEHFARFQDVSENNLTEPPKNSGTFITMPFQKATRKTSKLTNHADNVSMWKFCMQGLHKPIHAVLISESEKY
jgi:hypothetical protein